MSSAHAELPADDPGAVAEAVSRAAGGEVVRLVARDGRPVADVVPAAESDDERADRLTRQFIAATGAVPNFSHYRHVYERLGRPYPGDEEIARLHPVRAAS